MTLGEKILIIAKALKISDESLEKTFSINQGDFLKFSGYKSDDFSLSSIMKFKSISNVSIDFLLYGKIQCDMDKKAQEAIDFANSLKIKTDKLKVIIEKCKGVLDSQNLEYNNDILPFIDDNNQINYSCFEIDSKGNAYLSYSALVKNKQTDIIRKLFFDIIQPKDAIYLDNKELFEIAMNNYQKRISRNDLSSLLEGLNPDLNNYYYFIVKLIDAGAYYEKQIGEGDDITIFRYIADFSKTNFIYRIAKDMLKIQGKTL